MTDLKNKTVLVTGALRGIGEAAAREFVNHGAKVALLARSADAIEKIASELGDSAIAIACDVSNRQSIEAAVQTTIKKFGSLDILVNNAGALNPIGRLSEISADDWIKIIEINVHGVLYGIKAALPHMQNGGTIITIGSGAATSALEGWSHYCTSKAAVHHLNACLDKEERGNGIRALVLSPGTVATQMQRDIKESGINPVAQLDWKDHIPPQWAAKTLVWMCGPQSDDFRGSVVSLRDDHIRRRVGLIE